LRSVSLKGIAPKEKIRTGPGQLRPEFWLLGVDAEPHSGGRVPGVDVSAFRCLCEVRLEGAGVVGVGVDVDFDAGAGCDADGGLAWAELVAADVAAGDGADEAVVLPVFGLSDCGPLCAAVDDGQSVCEVSVKATGKIRKPSTVGAGHRRGSEEDDGVLHFGSGSEGVDLAGKLHKVSTDISMPSRLYIYSAIDTRRLTGGSRNRCSGR
jgi:hypothetical protein